MSPARAKSAAARGTRLVVVSAASQVSRRSRHVSQLSALVTATPTAAQVSRRFSMPPPAAAARFPNATFASLQRRVSALVSSVGGATRSRHAAAVLVMQTSAKPAPSVVQSSSVVAQVVRARVRVSMLRLPSRSADARQRSSGRPTRRGSATCAPVPPRSTRHASLSAGSARTRASSPERGTSNAVARASVHASRRARHVPTDAASPSETPCAAHASAAAANPSPLAAKRSLPTSLQACATMTARRASSCAVAAVARAQSRAARATQLASSGRNWRQRNAAKAQRCA